jgi:hypothetical protein
MESYISVVHERNEFFNNHWGAVGILQVILSQAERCFVGTLVIRFVTSSDTSLQGRGRLESNEFITANLCGKPEKPLTASLTHPYMYGPL